MASYILRNTFFKIHPLKFLSIQYGRGHSIPSYCHSHTGHTCMCTGPTQKRRNSTLWHWVNMNFRLWKKIISHFVESQNENSRRYVLSFRTFHQITPNPFWHHNCFVISNSIVKIHQKFRMYFFFKHFTFYVYIPVYSAYNGNKFPEISMCIIKQTASNKISFIFVWKFILFRMWLVFCVTKSDLSQNWISYRNLLLIHYFRHAAVFSSKKFNVAFLHY